MLKANTCAFVYITFCTKRNLQIFHLLYSYSRLSATKIVLLFLLSFTRQRLTSFKLRVTERFFAKMNLKGTIHFSYLYISSFRLIAIR